MSHKSKIDFLAQAQESEFRTYLYYVATEDVEINISRVQNRVNQGGHHVAEEKIRERYVRSLALLLSAIKVSNRAYIFDNSGAPDEHFLVAEVTNGTDLEIKSDYVPNWFNKAVLSKIV